MNMNEAIIPKSIREELTKGAKSESDHLWLIADRAAFIIDQCRRRKDELDITEYDVWSAIGHYCCKSPTRVRQIAIVGGFFAANIRASYLQRFGYWQFGYYEKALSCNYHVEDLFEFLSEYEKGNLIAPGRRLGVGEFVFVYEEHIQGKNTREGYTSSKVYAGRVAFNAVINASRQLKARLLLYMGKGPSVDRTLELISELEEVAPKAMEELGFTSTIVDKKQEVIYNHKG